MGPLDLTTCSTAEHAGMTDPFLKISKNLHTCKIRVASNRMRYQFPLGHHNCVSNWDGVTKKTLVMQILRQYRTLTPPKTKSFAIRHLDFFLSEKGRKKKNIYSTQDANSLLLLQRVMPSVSRAIITFDASYCLIIVPTGGLTWAWLAGRQIGRGCVGQ